MAEFRVGEIAILQNLNYYVDYNGMECTVIGALEEREGFNERTGQIEKVFGYRVHLPCHPKMGVVLPKQLRKRRPPPDWVKLCNLTDVPQEVVSHV